MKCRMMTLVACVAALAVSAAVADWQERDGWIGGQAGGQWVYRDVGKTPGANYTVSFDLKIEKATQAKGPSHQGRSFARYNNNENLGGYEAGLVLCRAESGQMYRLMCSSAWKEVLLWSSRGGCSRSDRSRSSRARPTGCVQTFKAGT